MSGTPYHRGAVRTSPRVAGRDAFASHVREWILVDDRHVQRVGTGEPPEAELTIDLPGTTIVPGFIDSHVHLTATGRSSRTPTCGVPLQAGLPRPGARARHRGSPSCTSRGSTRPGGTCRAPDRTRLRRDHADARRGDEGGRAHLRRELVDPRGDRPRRCGRRRGRRRATSDRPPHEGGQRAVAWVEASYDTRKIEGFQLQAAALAASRA